MDIMSKSPDARVTDNLLCRRPSLTSALRARWDIPVQSSKKSAVEGATPTAWLGIVFDPTNLHGELCEVEDESKNSVTAKIDEHHVREPPQAPVVPEAHTEQGAREVAELAVAAPAHGSGLEVAHARPQDARMHCGPAGNL